MIDEEDDDAGTSERVRERDEFHPALQSFRQSGHMWFDGEDLESGGVEMAKKLKRKGLVVHAVGVGTPSGGPIRVIGETGSIDTLKNAAGEEVLSRLDEKTLGEVAEATGGRFVRLGQAGEGMEALRLAIQAGTDERGAGRQGIPREEWFLGLALLLLVAESLLSTRRRPTTP